MQQRQDGVRKSEMPSKEVTELPTNLSQHDAAETRIRLPPKAEKIEAKY